MVGQTRTSPNGFAANGSNGDQPPPPPTMTVQEQFVVAQTEVMRQILQTQQLIAQQLQQNRGGNHEGPQPIAKYDHFVAMKPPLFDEAKEPLAADAWVRAIEAKLNVLTLPCSEERKASFAADPL